MSDIQEEQKRLYKRAKENDIKLLKEENKKLKELCNKYEEEHKTTFEEWKHLIKEDYKTRINKAIEYIEQIIDFVAEDKREIERDKYILKLLKGVDKE